MENQFKKYSDEDLPMPVEMDDDERREHRRHLTVMRVAKLANEALEIEGLGVVRNVSEGGMMITAHIAVEIGQVIAVSLLEDRKVLGEIIWKDGDSIGLRFDAPVSIAQVLERPATDEDGKKTRLPRLQVNRTGTVKGVGFKEAVTICDVSQRGAKLECKHRFAKGEQLLLVLGEQKVRGTVKWHKDGLTGLEFHRLLPVNELLHWLPND